MATTNIYHRIAGSPTLLSVVAMLSVAAVSGSAQSSASNGSTTFDAASIKPGDGARGIDVRFFPNRFVAMALTLDQLIQQAYGIEAREITGGPDWVRGDRFDVTATTAREVGKEQMQQMLRALLADRFQLQIAREERAGTMYTLTARTPKNLKSPAKPDERSLVAVIREDSNGFLHYRYEGHNAPMSALVQRLAAEVHGPVTDETMLTGRYDFSISYSYDVPFGGLQPDPDVPTIFTALETQVGLKLTAGKGPVPVWVIRRASRPTPD
jgi:uncharacterized protein (TIGR03435 family)